MPLYFGPVCAIRVKKLIEFDFTQQCLWSSLDRMQQQGICRGKNCFLPLVHIAINSRNYRHKFFSTYRPSHSYNNIKIMTFNNCSVEQASFRLGVVHLPSVLVQVQQVFHQVVVKISLFNYQQLLQLEPNGSLINWLSHCLLRTMTNFVRAVKIDLNKNHF